MKEYYTITKDILLITDVQEILSNNYKIKLSSEVEEDIVFCRDYLENKIENSEELYYGINTGFGALCNTSISKENLKKLQKNLVMSHACGIGEELDNISVKMMMLLKIKSLSLGHSGVRLELIERLIFFFNNNIFPVIYKLGSLGASGDLAPLAHMSLAIIGESYVNYNGKKRKTIEVLDEFSLIPLELQAKEGLALLNGTQFMTALGVNSIIKAKNIFSWADKISAISIDAFNVSLDPFIDEIHQVRKHKGQINTAKTIREILSGSEMSYKKKDNVQDPYSFRCVPQVHGASKDVFDYVYNVFETELNSVTDNPTIFPKQDKIISAGNFHGQPLALALDNLSIAMAEIGSISERRVYKLISGQRGLPPFLISNSGLNSGFMIAQYSAASIVSKNKQLCTPCAIDSIDSSNGQEDHVSMGANAATKTYEIIKNVEYLIAIELLASAQALEFRKPLKSSEVIENIISDYRKSVPFVEEDTIIHFLIQKSISFIKSDLVTEHLISSYR